MTVVIMILAIGLGLMVEQSAPSSVFIGFARPPVLALVMAYFALTHSASMMLFAALLGGILSDGIGALPLGITSFAFAVIGAVLHYYRHAVFSGKPITNIFFGAIIGISTPLIIFALLLFLNRTPYCLQLGQFFLKIIGTMIYGAVFFPVIYALLKRLELITGACRSDHFSDDTHSNN
ncbi:MAG: rod shape-determining protein MreD [Kiritimatiellia bacterium]|nr:rod shape-determining protein MreD [Kiritimatiellia bacterium]